MKDRDAVLRIVKDYARSLLIAALLSLGIRATIVEAYHVPTGSMIPTIMEHDRVMSNKLLYFFADPQPGDVIAFTPPPAARSSAPRFVKRVIGVAGDVIEVKNGMVFRNGAALMEPYRNDPPDYSLPLFRVPEGQLFVLGDNRRNSHDSHIWGFLPRSSVLSKVMFCYWPPARIGKVR